MPGLPYVEQPMTHSAVPSHSPPPPLSRTKPQHCHPGFSAGMIKPVDSIVDEAVVGTLQIRRRSSLLRGIGGVASDGIRSKANRASLQSDTVQFSSSLKNIRLGMNYYGDDDRVSLWRHKLYEPPTTANDPALKGIVAREYSLEKWCLEIANDTPTVHMCNYSLKEVPPPLMTMLHIRVLNLAWNDLTVLPPEIGHLVHLVNLDVSGNQLTVLPPEIGQEPGSEMSSFVTGGLMELEELDVSSNQITAIPDSYSRLFNLRSFAMKNNKLEELPRGYSRWKLLSCFSPSHNCLKVITHELCSMTVLVELDLSKNGITELPPMIGKLANLVRLDCSFNKLCQLPTTITSLKKLEVLLLIDNGLALLPSQFGDMSNLKELNLYHNLLQDLPVSMKHLDKVEIVDLDYNPLDNIPALIRDEGWPSIVAFLSSDAVTRRKIKLRDHTQTVGQGVLGKDVPKIVELRIQLEAKEQLKKKLKKGRKFNFAKFDDRKGKEILSKQVRTPKVDESTWLLFEGEGDLKKERKVRQTEQNRGLFEDIAAEIAAEGLSDEDESDSEDDSEDDTEDDSGDDDETATLEADIMAEENKSKASAASAFSSGKGSMVSAFGAVRRESRQRPKQALSPKITPRRANAAVLKNNAFNSDDGFSGHT